jgi:hypothetical protein
MGIDLDDLTGIVFPRETNSNGVHNPRRNGRNTTSVSMDAGLWTRMAIWTILQEGIYRRDVE